MHRLGEGRITFRLTSADRATAGTPKGLEERIPWMGTFGIPRNPWIVMHSPSPCGPAGQIPRHTGHGHDRIEQDIGAESSQLGVRELASVFCIRSRRLSGELVDPRIAYVSHETSKIKPQLNQPLSKPIQKGRVARRIADPHIVDRFDHPTTQKMGPSSISHIFRKNGVLRRCQPLCKRASRVALARHRLDCTERLGRSSSPIDGADCWVGFDVPEYSFLTWFHSGFSSDAGKEADEPIIVVHGPAIERVIVALGTLDLYAEEDL